MKGVYSFTEYLYNAHFLPAIVEFFLLLSNLAIDLLPNLAKLQLSPEHLVLLGF